MMSLLPWSFAYSAINSVSSEHCAYMVSEGVISHSPVDCNRLRVVTFSYINFEGIQNAENETLSVRPKASALKFVNRLNYRQNKAFRPGMAEDVIDIFAKNGFISWGGYWNAPIDYQHFEIGSKAFAKKLVTLSFKEGQDRFEEHIKRYHQCLSHGNLPHEATRANCVAQVSRESQKV